MWGGREAKGGRGEGREGGEWRDGDGGLLGMDMYWVNHSSLTIYIGCFSWDPERSKEGKTVMDGEAREGSLLGREGGIAS